jgi:hypothetical protein
VTKATLELRISIEAEGRVVVESDGARTYTEIEDMVVYAVGRNGQRVELPYDWFVAGDLRAVREAIIDAEFEERS